MAWAADMKIIYITLSHSGQVVEMGWYEAGLVLPFQDGNLDLADVRQLAGMNGSVWHG